MLDTINALKQKRVTITQNGDCPQVIAIFTASMLSLSTGMIFAYASPAIPKLIAEYGFTIEDASYFPIIPPIAMIVATPVYCQLMDSHGRKYILLSAGVLHVISWLILAFADTIYLFHTSRVFLGIAEACVFAVLPTYIAETTTPNVRSSYGNIMVISSLIGRFLTNCIGYYFSIQLSSLIMLLIPILFMITFGFMPDTPYYLLKSGKTERAMKSLRQLRGSKDVNVELLQISLGLQKQLSESGRLKDLFLVKSNRKALAIATISRAFQQYSGSASLTVYAQYILNEGGGNISSGVGAIIVSGIFVAVNLFANIICDKLGRRKSMIFSCLGCGIILLAESIWFPLFGLASYALAYCVGLGPIPNLLIGEVFSTNMRQHGITISNVIFGINTCVALKLFQFLMSTYGMWTSFLVFGLCCLVSSICSYFTIPETKGKALEEIQQMLKEGKIEKPKQDTTEVWSTANEIRVNRSKIIKEFIEAGGGGVCTVKY
ncbi:hypothetical protein Trydic_g4151 [Trypoxylus dichotomus]